VSDPNNYFKPESMVAGNASGAVIAGIGGAASQLLGVPNGYAIVFASLLFGIIIVSKNRKPGTGKLMAGVYIVLGTAIGMWEAVQSGTFVLQSIDTPALIEKVRANEKDTVFVNRAGMYVAVRVTDEGFDEHLAPRWAIDMYCQHLSPASKDSANPKKKRFLQF